MDTVATMTGVRTRRGLGWTAARRTLCVSGVLVFLAGCSEKKSSRERVVEEVEARGGETAQLQPAPVGHVELRVEAEGFIDKAALIEAVADSPAIYQAYGEILESPGGAEFRGRVVVKFRIGVDGTIDPAFETSGGAQGYDFSGSRAPDEALLTTTVGLSAGTQALPKPTSGSVDVVVSWLFGYHDEDAVVVSAPVDMIASNERALDVQTVRGELLSRPEKYRLSRLAVAGIANLSDASNDSVVYLKQDGEQVVACFLPPGMSSRVEDGDAVIVKGKTSIGRRLSSRVLRLSACSVERDLEVAAAVAAPGGSASPSNTKGNAALGTASVSGGAVTNAATVVAGMAAGFRRCYQKGLVEDASMKGTVRITARIGPAGEVQSAAPSSGGGLSSTVTSCVAGVVSSRTFDKPAGGGATIVIPVSFSPAS